MTQKKHWIFAYKDDKPTESADFGFRIIKTKAGSYYAEGIIENLEERYAGLEYGDVAKGEYQLWEYPSGKIFQIESDRAVAENDHYSTPYVGDRTVWLPKLVLQGTEREKVNAIYKWLSTPQKKKSLFEKLIGMFK